MVKPAPHRIIRELTPEEKKRFEKALAETEAEKPWILEQARAWKAAHDAAIGQLSEAFRLLRAERERQGLSLADMQERTGMQRSAICKLENELEGNPKIVTLQRYADALGKQLMVVVADKDESKPRRKK